MSISEYENKIALYACKDGWYVLGGCSTVWRIALILDGKVIRTKKIGKVKMRGTNYFDKACKVADERNEEKGYKVDCHLPMLK